MQSLCNTLLASLQSLFILCKASAVCDPHFKDFYKIQSKTFTFCTSPIPRLCPVCLIPKATKEMCEKSSFTLTFTFYSNPSKKMNQIFGCGGSFPSYIVAQIFESKTLGRVVATVIQRRQRTDFKVAKEEDQF